MHTAELSVHGGRQPCGTEAHTHGVVGPESCLSDAWLSPLPPPCTLTPPSSCRAAHQRLVAHAEEVAFNDPPAGAAEQLILNQHLQRLITFTRLSSFQRFLQQVRGWV